MVHEEQHRRWLVPGAEGLSENLVADGGVVCRGEFWRWVLVLVVELILGFRPRQAPGQRLLRADGQGVEGSCLPAAGISSRN